MSRSRDSPVVDRASRWGGVVGGWSRGCSRGSFLVSWGLISGGGGAIPGAARRTDVVCSTADRRTGHRARHQAGGVHLAEVPGLELQVLQLGGEGFDLGKRGFERDSTWGNGEMGRALSLSHFQSQIHHSFNTVSGKLSFLPL